eukprot:NODE_162_length_14959_cov_1.379610.p4 type:complete len:377 gc:universal NODE_162_length_14959_cov_1.379610:12280-11150(-)
MKSEIYVNFSPVDIRAYDLLKLFYPNPSNLESRKGRRILITGCAGFISSHFTRFMVTKYSHNYVLGIDKIDYCSSVHNFYDLLQLDNFEFVKADVTQFDFVYYLLKHHRIDTIVHLAAQSHVDNSFGDSFNFTQNNVLGTHILLEAARLVGIELFIHVSTDEVYGSVTNGERKEDHLLSPSNPYSASKASAEHICGAYHKSYKIPLIIVRSNNVYGPCQYPEKVIPKFILLRDKNQKLPIHGDGSHSRRYLHVADVVKALDLILRRGQIGQVYNIGIDNEFTNLELARYIVNLENRDIENADKELQFVRDRFFNDQRYAVDATKLKELGWQPSVSFTEGLKATIEWYKSYSSQWWSSIDDALLPHPSRTKFMREIQ